MNVTVMDRQADTSAQTKLGIVDCDVHPYTKSPADLDQFLPERWRKLRASIGGRSRSPFSNAPNYPRMSPFTGMRMDSYPKDGTHPGSDLEMMQAQLLDLFNVSYGLMMPLLGRAADERNVELGAAMATAANEWEAQVWCDREPRLKAGVQIPLEYTEAAVKEIEKRAGDRRFTHVMIPPRGLEPLGRRRYWPILEACAANGFSIALHLGGTSGHPSTGGGWPSFYHEEHPSYPQSKEALVTSLVIEGVADLAARQALQAPARGSAASEASAVGIHPLEHLGDDAADRGAGATRGSAGDVRVDRLGPHHVLDRLPTLGPGRSALRLQGAADRAAQADGVPRERVVVLRPGVSVWSGTLSHPSARSRRAPARSSRSPVARSASSMWRTSSSR
jgi:predicted TIM-barrel fold metal-dependent hydrolase